MLTRKPVNRRRDEQLRAAWLKRLDWRQLSLAGGGLAAVGCAAFALLWLLDQPIQRITVEGSFQRVSAVDIEKAARGRVAGAGLVSVKLPEVCAALRQLAWIDQVTVQRSWPRGLRVQVTEQVAVARWNDTDLVNARGELFKSDARFMPAGLPQLSGPEGTAPDVVQRYLGSQGRMVEGGMRLVALQVDARGAWDFTLDNGVNVRLGRGQVDERYQRFVDVVLRMVSERAADIAYVDMRYTNGFAIGWRGNPTRLARHPATQELHPDA
jgi:cell division protein FtsQ